VQFPVAVCAEDDALCHLSGDCFKGAPALFPLAYLYLLRRGIAVMEIETGWRGFPAANTRMFALERLQEHRNRMFLSSVSGIGSCVGAIAKVPAMFGVPLPRLVARFTVRPVGITPTNLIALGEQEEAGQGLDGIASRAPLESSGYGILHLHSEPPFGCHASGRSQRRGGISAPSILPVHQMGRHV
jgi:hypothetical protein